MNYWKKIRQDHSIHTLDAIRVPSYYIGWYMTQAKIAMMIEEDKKIMDTINKEIDDELLA